MAKLVSFIIVLTLLTVAHASLPGPRKMLPRKSVIPIRETVELCPPDTCTPTEEGEKDECPEGCICDDTEEKCRVKTCQDEPACVNDDNCPSHCRCVYEHNYCDERAQNYD